MPSRIDIAAQRLVSAHPVLSAFILATVLFSASRLFLSIHYAENDDVVMRMLVSGTYSGDIDTLLVFQNYFFSSALGVLYGLVPGIDWYSNIFLGLQCLAFASFLVGLLKSREYQTATSALATVCLLAVFLATTIQMQFTTTAGALSASGAVAIVLATSRTYTLFGAVMMLLGFLIRFEAAALSLTVLGAICVAAIVERQIGKQVVTTIAVTIIIAFALHATSDTKMRTLAPDYIAFNEFRGGVNDNPNNILEPDRLPDAVSSNDYELLVHFLPDIQRFTQDNATHISAALTEIERQLGLSDIVTAAAELGANPVLLFALVLLLLIFATAAKPTDRALSLLAFAVVCGLMVYLQMTADVKERVQLVVVTSILAALLMHTPTTPSRMSEWTRALPLLVILPLLLIQSGQRAVENSHLSMVFSNQKTTVAEWPGAIVVFKNHFRVTGAPVFSGELDSLTGRLVFAGWVTGHPGNSALYEGHASFLEGDKALFYDPNRSADSDPVHRILTSLSDNYDIEAQPETLASGPFGQLVAFRRKR